MSVTLFVRSFRPLLASIDKSAFVCHVCRRQESSFRRTRKALRVQPDPSFVPSKTEPQDHIIFNPPSSAPNVYHTPSKFLPKSDPRRKFHSTAPASTTTQTSTPADSAPLNSTTATEKLSPIREQYEKKYHLGQAEIDEIRRLRAEDPRKWTRVRLAEKFECSQFFVSLCCSAPEIKQENDRALAVIKKKWGRRKTEAREERKARKTLWGRDA